MSISEFNTLLSNSTLASICCDVTEMPPSEYVYLVQSWKNLKQAQKHASDMKKKATRTSVEAAAEGVVATAATCRAALAAGVLWVVPRRMGCCITVCGWCGLRRLK
eukprot:2735362-Rhodomonas_salina.1